MTLISVLLPVFNAERTVLSALRSIQRQSHRHLEIVAVDDGSTDQSAERVASAARRDPRIKLHPLPRVGLCAALNRGLAHCEGDWVARMDADDISLRDRLSLQLACLEAHPGVGAVGCQVQVVPRRDLTDGMRRYEEWSNSLVQPEDIRRDLFVESPLCHPSVMIRARAVRGVGGYSDGGGMWPEDYDLWLRLDAAGYDLAKVERPLLLWRDGPGRLSRAHPAYGRERFFALKVRHLLARVRREHGPKELLVWGAGREGKAWLRALVGASLLADCVVDIDPRKVGQRIHGCRVVHPDTLGPPRPGTLLLAAVGARGARDAIRRFLQDRGYRESEHFVCVA